LVPPPAGHARRATTAAQQTAIASARQLGIGVVHCVSAAVDILDQASDALTNPSVLKRIASMVGWK